MRGVSPTLSRCAGGQETDKEVDAGGLAFVVSIFITTEGADATAGSEVLSSGEEDVTIATGIPMGLPFCFTCGLSLPSELTVSSLLGSWKVRSLETQPDC